MISISAGEIIIMNKMMVHFLILIEIAAAAFSGRKAPRVDRLAAAALN